MVDDYLNSIDEAVIIESIDDDYVDWGLKVIKAPSVWHKTMGEGVKIATIDTGVDMHHEDLCGNIYTNFNTINKTLDTTDHYGHGSHVAGLLIGSKTGVAPKAELCVIKVLDDNGHGEIAKIMDGISFAMESKVDILCISLGVNRVLPLILQQKIIHAYERGITIVSAVGNNGVSTSLYPARMDEVIAVGGLDKDLNEASFSNGEYDVLAPSVDILSTWKDGSYARVTGTSMASPLVAGAIALLISYNRKNGIELRPSEIKSMISGKLDLTELIK